MLFRRTNCLLKTHLRSAYRVRYYPQRLWDLCHLSLAVNCLNVRDVYLSREQNGDVYLEEASVLE